MKKITSILAAGTAAILGSPMADAASVNASVTGTISDLTYWNGGPTASASAFEIYWDVANASYTGPFQNFSMNVSGSITYDDSTGAISALSFAQVGSLSGLRSRNGLNSSPSDDPFITLSGFSWTLSGTSLLLDNYTDGSSANGPYISCAIGTSGAPGAACTAANMDSSNTVARSALVGYDTTGVSNVATDSALQFDGYQFSGFTGIDDGSITVNLGNLQISELLNGRSTVFPAFGLPNGQRSTANLNLQAQVVPAPGAFGLLGTALGLLGVRRFRKA